MRFAQSSAVYYNYSLQYAIRDLHALGYDGVEVWGGRPHMYRSDLDGRVEEIRGLLDASGMEVCNFLPAQFRYPSILCAENETVRRDSVAYLKTAVDNAVKLRAPTVSLCPGMVLFDGDLQKGRLQLVRSLEELVEYAEDKGIVLLIEPAHRFESNLIRTVEDGLRLIEALKSERFGILIDTGHCHLNGEKLEEVIPRCQGIPLHIHINDNRGDADAHLIPGAGTLDFQGLPRALSRIGYSGYLSAELSPAYITDPTRACEDTLRFLRACLQGSP